MNPSIANEFSTAAYRFGHSMLDDDISRLNNDGTDIPEGSVKLMNAFFNPTLLDTSLPNDYGDSDPILKGAATGDAQEIDVSVVDSVRNFLFGPPGAGGFDLASLNIQRGRDHGLADYNSLRAAYGLPRVTTFAQITPTAPSRPPSRKPTAPSTTSTPGSVASPKTMPPAPASAGPSSASSRTNSPASATATDSGSRTSSVAGNSTTLSTRRWPM